MRFSKDAFEYHLGAFDYGSKKTHVKCGFLRGIGPARLRQMHKEEKNPKAKDRLLAYAMRKEGMSVYAIADSLNKPYSTIRDWLGRAVNDGLGGIYDETRQGASCRLTPEQLRQLRTDLVAGPDRCGFKSSLWTARLLIIHVRKKFGVKYASSGMYDLLHRMLLITQAKAKTPKGSLRIRTKCV